MVIQRGPSQSLHYRMCFKRVGWRKRWRAFLLRLLPSQVLNMKIKCVTVKVVGKLVRRPHFLPVESYWELHSSFHTSARLGLKRSSVHRCERWPLNSQNIVSNLHWSKEQAQGLHKSCKRIHGFLTVGTTRRAQTPVPVQHNLPSFQIKTNVF